MDKDKSKLSNRIVWLGIALAVILICWIISLVAICRSALDGVVFGFQCGAAIVFAILAIALIVHYSRKIKAYEASRPSRDDREMDQVHPSTVESMSTWFLVGILCVFCGFLFGFAMKVAAIILLIAGVVCLIIGYCLKISRQKSEGAEKDDRLPMYGA